MSILFKRLERLNPGNPLAPPKWFANLKSIGKISEKEVAKQLADETTLNPKEAEMAISQFEKVLIRLLLDGHTVSLGDWGSFRVTCNSSASDTKKEVTAANIKNLNIRFTPGTDLKNALKKAHFVDAETI